MMEKDSCDYEGYFYKKKLCKSSVIFQKIPGKILSSYHLFIIQVSKKINRDLIFKKILIYCSIRSYLDFGSVFNSSLITPYLIKILYFM